MTTENSRADALTDEQRIGLEKAMAWCPHGSSEANTIRELLAASPALQPAAAPIPLKAQLRRVMDLLDTHLGDSDLMLEGMTQEEIEEEFPVVAAMQIIVGLYQDPPTASDTAPSPADELAALWQTGTPPTKAGSYDEYIIAVRRKTNPARVFVFASNYANEYIDDNEDDEQKPRTGWYMQAADMGGEYAYVYEQTLNEGDEVLGWQALPKWNDEARAASANEGAEGALRAALQRLEDACDQRAALLTSDAYNAAATIPGMRDALYELDYARKQATEALSRSPAIAAGAVAAGHGLAGIPRAAFGPHTEADRIDHCGTCGAENEPQKDDLCPTCGATCSLISTWGEFQHTRYRNGQRYANNGPQWWEDGPQPAAPLPAQADARVGLTAEQRVAIQECIDYLKPAAKDFADLDMGDSKHARCIRTLRALLAAHPGQPEPRAEVTNAARDVLAERRRQIEAEGWTPERDDKYTKRELAYAASNYAVSELKHGDPPITWPWDKRWWKPTTPRRNLVKAGALILAEIERLDRATTSALLTPLPDPAQVAAESPDWIKNALPPEGA